MEIVFAGENHREMRSYGTRINPTLLTVVHIERRKFGQATTEMGVMNLQNPGTPRAAGSRQKLREERELPEGASAATPGFWTSGLQHCGCSTPPVTVICCCSPRELGHSPNPSPVLSSFFLCFFAVCLSHENASSVRAGPCLSCL